MKSGERSKLVRGLRQESRRFRLLVIVVGFFLVSLTFVVLSKPEAILFSLNGKLPVNSAPATSGKASTDALRGDPRVVDDEADEEESHVLSEPDPTSGMAELTPNKDGGGRQSDMETLGGGGDGEGKGKMGEERANAAEKHRVTLPTVSNYTIHDSEDTENG
nr:unnamed protein product [Digitaria exilis]